MWSSIVLLALPTSRSVNPASGQRLQVLASFKSLLKASRLTFSGDPQNLANARLAIRTEFAKHSSVIESSEVDKLIQLADDSARFIRSNIVQGIKSKEAGDTFHLRLTKDTELNDNETIKTQKGKSLPSNFPKRCDI